MSLLLLYVYTPTPRAAFYSAGIAEIVPEDILWIWEANRDAEDY
jgi:hypothetical protein